MAEICSDPVLHMEARAIAPMLQRAAQPCGASAVREVLKPLTLVYPPGKRAEAPAFWDVYFRVLGQLPYEALVKAADEFPNHATDARFPVPGELKELAEKFAIPIRKAAYRAKRAADSLPRRPAPAKDAEAVRRMAEEAAAILTSKKDPA